MKKGCRKGVGGIGEGYSRDARGVHSIKKGHSRVTGGVQKKYYLFICLFIYR